MDISKKKFLVQGGTPLQGEVAIHGSKNAALPMIAATLLTKERCVLHNVPRIEDVFSMKQILEELGAVISFEGNTFIIDSSGLSSGVITSSLAQRMRASVLLVPGLLHRFGEVRIPFPGGCVLGKRPLDTHLRVFEGLGATVHMEEDGTIVLHAKEIRGARIVLNELSVTASENALMMAACASGSSELRLLASEPHVTNTAELLRAMGARMEGVGGNFIRVEGASELHGVEFTVTPDYLETGTFAIAAALTRGDVRIVNTDTSQLDIVWEHMEAMGVGLELEENALRVFHKGPLKSLAKLQTGVYPQFPTDLQAPFAVLFTQAQGVSKVFETMFEGRLNYLMELEKMRAHTEILNPHQAIIIGPTPLRGAQVSSWDIRAGTAIVLAALAAEGETEINNIYYIDRGYERIDEKLNRLGANIQRIETV